MRNSPDSSVSLQALLLIAVSYVALGVAGLSLAIPPGYASPVFPAAGFSLAVALRFGPRVLPAIWLGSFLLNVGVAMSNANLSFSALLVAAGIGAGAALQAGVGRFLINRWSTEKWRHLEQEKDILQFSLLGGVLASLVSATFGVSSLMLVDIVPPTAFGYAWWTWFVGDALGVLISAPLILGLLLRRQSDWGNRLKALALPVLGMLLLAVAAFLGAARWESWSRQAKLDDQGDLAAAALERRFIAHRETLAALARAIEVIPELSLTQFEHFASATLQAQPDIFALSFNPYVTLARRNAFERQMAAKYPGGTFQITERNAEHELVRAGDRPEYIAVGYISPLEGNKPAVGFDISSEPKRRDAIARAQKSGQTAATEPIRLVQEEKRRVGVLLLAPVFQQQGDSPATDAEHDLTGFVVDVIKVDEMIAIALQGIMSPGLVISIEDPATDQANQVLYRSESKSAVAGGEPAWRKRLTMADREWILKLFVTEEYVRQHRSWIAWGVGVAGLLFVGLLQLSLLAMTGRTALIDRRVSEQTEEISAKNTALIKSEEKYRSVVESIKEVIFQTDAQGLWTFLNPAWTEVTGFGVQESLGELYLNHVHPDDRQRNIELFEPLLQRKKDYCRDVTRYLRQNGDICWIEVYARPTLDATGQVIGIAGTLLDVTERRMGEQALRENESRLRSITDSTHDAILIMAPNGQISFWNPAAESLFGYSKEEAIGQDLHFLLAPKRYHEAIQSHLFHFRETGQGNAVGKITEFFAVRKDGVEISISLSLAAHKTGNGWHAIGTIRDTTELRRLEQIKDDVERIVRHDLKAPLTGLINIPRLLLEDDNLTPEQQKLLGMVDASARKMLRLINSSLEIYKIESGTYRLLPKRCCLAKLIRCNIDMLTHDVNIVSKQVIFRDHTIVSGESQAHLETDELLLDIILMNILRNALEASEDKDQITIDLKENDTSCTIAISNAKAVPMEIRDRFFEKYVTSKKSGGTGLGTYSAYIMTQALQGTIEMETSDTTGTKVTISIPKLTDL